MFNLLKDHEIILMSKCISDKIDILKVLSETCMDMNDKKLDMIEVKNRVDEFCNKNVSNSLRRFVFNVLASRYIITNIDKLCEDMLKLISSFLSWRLYVAFRPDKVIFTESKDRVVDELTMINKFLDIGYLCKSLSSYAEELPRTYYEVKNLVDGVIP